MAKKSNLVRLGDVISEILRKDKLDVRIAQFSVKNSWKEIAGEMIARHTTSVHFNEKVVFVTLSNAALKHELSFRKQQLIDNINRFCGTNLVSELVIR